MGISQNLYVFYKRHFAVGKPQMDRLYYPKLLLYKCLKAIGLGRLKASITDSTVRVGPFVMQVDAHDSLNLLVKPDMDPAEISLVNLILKPGDAALDVGANIGLYALHMANSVGPDGRVMAFEPEPSNFALLKHNVTANGFENVDLRRLAASDEAGEASLAVNAENLGMHRLIEGADAGETVSVETAPIDTLVKDRAWATRVRFAKIDVEGHELSVLKGMSTLLDRNPELHLLVEFCPSALAENNTSPEDLLNFLGSRDFRHEIAGDDHLVSAEELLKSFPADSPAYANLHCFR